MSLDAKDVTKIAHLARLQIDDSALPEYARDLSSILHLVEQMEQVDTKGVLPMAHPLDAVQRLRPDAATETNQREQFQKVAPQTEAGLYLVPRVVE